MKNCKKIEIDHTDTFPATRTTTIEPFFSIVFLVIKTWFYIIVMNWWKWSIDGLIKSSKWRLILVLPSMIDLLGSQRFSFPHSAKSRWWGPVHHSSSPHLPLGTNPPFSSHTISLFCSLMVEWLVWLNNSVQKHCGATIPKIVLLKQCIVLFGLLSVKPFCMIAKAK